MWQQMLISSAYNTFNGIFMSEYLLHRRAAPGLGSPAQRLAIPACAAALAILVGVNAISNEGPRR